MVCIKWLNHVLCFTRDVTVEEAIMKTIFEGKYLHDDLACVDTKMIVDRVTSEFKQFNRVDVVQGIVQLLYENRIIERYPNEYQVNESWSG